MTIRPGSLWGERLGAVPGIAVAADDATAAAVLAPGAAPDPGTAGPAAPSAPHRVALTGGSMWSFLGGATAVGRWRTDDAHHHPVDLLEVEIGTTTAWVLATLHARRRGRPVAIVGNVGHWHRYRALPRAHPGDGLVDAIWGDLGWSDLLVVGRRAVTGTHLPHPAITERRAALVVVELERSAVWFADGRRLANGPTARITVHPDAGIVVV